MLLLDAINTIGEYCKNNLAPSWQLELLLQNGEMRSELYDDRGDREEGWESPDDDPNPIIAACEYSVGMWMDGCS